MKWVFQRTCVVLVVTTIAFSGLKFCKTFGRNALTSEERSSGWRQSLATRCFDWEKTEDCLANHFSNAIIACLADEGERRKTARSGAKSPEPETTGDGQETECGETGTLCLNAKYLVCSLVLRVNSDTSWSFQSGVCVSVLINFDLYCQCRSKNLKRKTGSWSSLRKNRTEQSWCTTPCQRKREKKQTRWRNYWLMRGI